MCVHRKRPLEMALVTSNNEINQALHFALKVDSGSTWVRELVVGWGQSSAPLPKVFPNSH